MYQNTEEILYRILNTIQGKLKFDKQSATYIDRSSRPPYKHTGAKIARAIDGWRASAESAAREALPYLLSFLHRALSCVESGEHRFELSGGGAIYDRIPDREIPHELL